MPGALTPSRPVFYDAETYNGTADLGSLHRKLVQWVRWTYGRDAYYKPCNVVSGDGNGLGSGNLGSFYAPQPTTPAQRLVLQVYVDLAGNAAAWVDLAFVGSRGNEKTVHVDSAALGGGGATVGWYECTFPCAPDSIVEVTATASASSVNVKSLCGWWEPLTTGSGLTLPGGALSFISRTWAAQDKPDSAYFLASVAQLANRYAATRPRMVVATSYAAMGAQGAGTYDAARYKVLVGEGIGQVDVDEIQHSVPAADGDIVFRLYEDGSLIATGNATAGATRFSFGTVSITKGAARAVEFKITAQVVNGTHYAGWALIFEQPMLTADLGLASGDTVPGSFPALDPAAGRGGAPIKATGVRGRAGILDALIWLYAKRRRVLVDDRGVFGTIIEEVGSPVTHQYVVRAAVRRVLTAPDPTYGIMDAYGWIDIGGTLFPPAGGEMYGAPAPGEFGKWVTRGPAAPGTGTIWAQSYTTPGLTAYAQWVALSAEGAAVTVP